MYKEDRTETVQVRLTKVEKASLECIASQMNRTPALALRHLFLEYLKGNQNETTNSNR